MFILKRVKLSTANIIWFSKPYIILYTKYDLFLGPPGVGKTTTILCLARHLLGASFKGESLISIVSIISVEMGYLINSNKLNVPLNF